MIQQEKKYLGDPQSASGNFDDADFAIGLNQWTNLENFRIGSTDAGVTGTLESIGSTLLKSGIEPSVTHIPLGNAIPDNENNRFCYFLKDKYGALDKIMCYDYNTDTVYLVLSAGQVVGGLNFDKLSLVHSGYIINGLLYWTDNLNQLRRINIDAGIKLNNPSYITDQAAYTSPLQQWVITIIRRPPILPIVATKILASSIPITIDYNFIKNEAFRFSWKYWYRDNEESVLGAFSNLIDRNLTSETYDTVKLVCPLQEIIEQDVQSIDLVVQFADDDSTFIVKSWDKNNPTDLAEIQAHNNGSAALTYYFFNNQVGAALDPAYVVKQYDSVPRKSETLTFAKNRLFVGNNLSGFDTPISTSLTLSTVAQTGATTGNYQWHEFTVFINGCYFPGEPLYAGGSGSRNLIYFDNISVPGYYYPNYSGYPSGVTAFSDYTFYAADISSAVALLANEIAVANVFVDYAIDSYSDNIIMTIAVSAVSTSLANGANIYKASGIYGCGIVFYDFAQRHCGVLLPTDNKISIPERTYSALSNITGISWTLSNASALTEIPDWAYYYQIVRTKNLKTRNFIEGRTTRRKYVSKDTTTGAYIYSNTYSANAYGLAVDLSVINSYGLGYSYQEGDILKLYITGYSFSYTLPVLATDGTYVIVQLINLSGAGETSDAIIEIYEPYRSSINEPYFEVSQCYSITNPTTSSRQYSSLSGTIAGDIYAIDETYAAVTNRIEFMSPNHAYWKIWNTICSKPIYIDKIGEQQKTQTINYSNVFIQGTKINGISSFEPLNEKSLPLEDGAIKKLQLTSKVENEQGIVMLAICVNQTSSLYIGESQQYGSNKQTNLVVYEDVIGTINTLKGNFGTVNAESVVEFRGNVYWLDANSGKIIQYSAAGLFPISNYKMTRFWKLFSDQYLSMTTDEIEALGSRPFIFAMVDPHHGELLFSIPKLLAVPPKGYLPDYSSTIYPFDIWDGQGKTIVYRVMSNPNFWQGAYSFNPEGFASLQNKLYSFKNGHLYEHNQLDSQCNFYGTQYKPKVMLVSNMNGTVPKVYDNISIQSNILPTFVYLYGDYPYQQASDLEDISFQDREGIWYANILRNKLVPTAIGYDTNGLLTGEKMRNTALRLMVEFTVGTTQLELKFVYIGFSISKGHNF
jgi:hypothetical protein